MAEFNCRLDSSTSLSRSPGALVWLKYSRKSGDGRRRAREQRGIGRAAARLDELRRCDILIVEQGGGRQIDETGALIRPVVENLGHAEGRLADAQHGAQLQLQLRNDARIDPHLAAAGNFIGAARRAERRIRDAQMPAQRIIRGHRIERGELA